MPGYWTKLVRTDAYENMLWNKTCGGGWYNFEGFAHSLVKTFDGGYAITGFNKLVNTDDLGNVLWIQRYGQEL